MIVGWLHQNGSHIHRAVDPQTPKLACSGVPITRFYTQWDASLPFVELCRRCWPNGATEPPAALERGPDAPTGVGP